MAALGPVPLFNSLPPSVIQIRGLPTVGDRIRILPVLSIGEAKTTTPFLANNGACDSGEQLQIYESLRPKLCK
jgi:hypothetical protein